MYNKVLKVLKTIPKQNRYDIIYIRECLPAAGRHKGPKDIVFQLMKIFGYIFYIFSMYCMCNVYKDNMNL